MPVLSLVADGRARAPTQRLPIADEMADRDRLAVVFIGAIAVYLYLTTDVAKFGEVCDQDRTCEEPRGTCLLTGSGSNAKGTCTRHCDVPSDCPTGSVCELALVVQYGRDVSNLRRAVTAGTLL
jgi:hypothetical protein